MMFVISEEIQHNVELVPSGGNIILKIDGVCVLRLDSHHECIVLYPYLKDGLGLKLTSDGFRFAKVRTSV